MSGHQVKARRLTGKPLGRPSVEAAQLRDEVSRQAAETRCRDAFFETYAAHGATMDLTENYDYAQWVGWRACWKYLEQRAQEFIES